MESYWRDVGTVDAYWAAHRDLPGDPPRLDLDDRAWPIPTHAAQRPPARLRPAATVRDSLVAPACVLPGTVAGSVLGPGVVVEAGASVVDSVVLGDAVVRAGVRVTRAVLDERSTIGRGARVGSAAGGITVTGRDSAVADDAELDAESDTEDER